MDQGELIETLHAKSASLHAAMMTGNLVAIEQATEDFRETVALAKSVRNWQKQPALRAAIVGLREQLEQSRAMACLLADMTGQMHDFVIARARDGRQPVYSRQGIRTA
jgi:hypothetical protein